MCKFGFPSFDIHLLFYDAILYAELKKINDGQELMFLMNALAIGVASHIKKLSLPKRLTRTQCHVGAQRCPVRKAKYRLKLI